MIGSLSSVPALADSFYPFISASFNYDDNLFRLPDGQIQLGETRSDTYRNVIGGIRFERPVSRQIFSGTAGFSSITFDHNSQLDFVGKNMNADWHWFVASHFEGHLGANYEQALAPFADFHSEQRNLRVNKRQYVDGSWRFHPSWRWRNSYERTQNDYQLLAQRVNDRADDSMVTGIDFLAASGSTVGFQFRHLKDSFPNGQPTGVGTYGNGYVQNEAKLNVLWIATGTTQVLFLGGWAQHKQNTLVERTDTGTNARLIVTWAPHGRVKVVGQTWHEFAAIDGALVNSALSTGASADATWDVSEKVQAVASARREIRNLSGVSGASGGLSSDVPGDSTQYATVGVVYKPLRKLTLKVSAFRDQRSGSPIAGTNSYKANGASINVVQQF